jgi:hypothetical protein
MEIQQPDIQNETTLLVPLFLLHPCEKSEEVDSDN